MQLGMNGFNYHFLFSFFLLDRLRYTLTFIRIFQNFDEGQEIYMLLSGIIIT